MGNFEEILAGVPQEIKTLEVDTEKKVFKLNGVDFGDGCDYFRYRVLAEMVLKFAWFFQSVSSVPTMD